MESLLRGARLVDPQLGLDAVADVLVGNGRIEQVGTDLEPREDAQVVDLAGKVVVPGLVDAHVHLREPGYEYKETIESGTRAAVHGGFVGVACMPNTDPVCDTGSRVQFVCDEARAHGHCHVYPVGAISHALEGRVLSEMGDMAAHGAVAFSDDGRGVQDDGMMRRGMDYAKAFGLPVLAHCQRESLVGTGVVNEGVASTRLGMAGWPAEGEEVEIARDVMLCRLTGCRLHVQHVTTERGLKLVEDARTQGLPVTCEVTPHHLFLCEDDITDDFDTNLKVNPPLRTRADMECLQQALCDGRIDCVSTDHAPHAAHEKALEFELAPFGTTGLETALGLLWTELVSTGRLGLDRLVEAMAVRPRALLGLAPVTLASGSAADLTVIDPDMKTKVEKSWFESRSDNSAFLGRELTGGASDVMVAGRFRLRDGKVVR